MRDAKDVREPRHIKERWGKDEMMLGSVKAHQIEISSPIMGAMYSFNKHYGITTTFQIENKEKSMIPDLIELNYEQVKGWVGCQGS